MLCVPFFWAKKVMPGVCPAINQNPRNHEVKQTVSKTDSFAF